MNTRIKEAFDKVYAEDELKNHTKQFLAEQTNGYTKRSLTAYKRLIAAVVCFVLVLFGWKGYSVYFTPAFAISVDINPSIELGINLFDKVVSVEAYNEDGSAILSSLDVHHLNYQEALERILSDKIMEQYLTEDQDISVTVFGADEDKNNEMFTKVTACTEPYANVHCSSCNSEEVSAAHDAGLSFGKYKAFLELYALNPEITVEDVQGLTMRQIRDMIDALSDGSGNVEQENNGNRGHGSGCEGGNQRGSCHNHGN